MPLVAESSDCLPEAMRMWCSRIRLLNDTSSHAVLDSVGLFGGPVVALDNVLPPPLRIASTENTANVLVQL